MSTNEIAQRNDVAHHEADTGGNLNILPPRQPVNAIARQTLLDHAELADMAYQFAEKLVGTEMVPTRFRNKPEEATAAILFGAELGMPPISALQNIFAVHGTPGIYARTAQALLETKGYSFRTVENTIDSATIYGWKPGSAVVLDPDTKQRICPDEQSQFTYDDAERAGWTPVRREDQTKGGRLIRGVRYELNNNNKLVGNEKYLAQPKQMLWAKAMMEVCRRLSPATLLGIAYSVEELQDEYGTDAAPSRAPAPAAPADRADVLTVDEILSAGTDSQPADDPAIVQHAKAAKAKRAKRAEAGESMSRVEEALAKARAANPPSAPAPAVTGGSAAADRATQALAAAQEATEPAESQPDLGDDPDGDNTWEPTPDPSEEEEPGGPPEDEAQQEPEPPAPAAEAAPAKASKAKAADGPADQEQLKELAAQIQAAKFQPTDEGRQIWFAYASDVVGRDIRANNQLKAGEVAKLIKQLKADQAQ